MKNIVVKLIKHPLFSGSAVMLIGSNFVNFVNYLYHLVMGRLLGPASYSELAAIISVIGILGVIPVSLNLVVTKYISSSNRDADIADLIFWLKDKIFKASLILFVFIIIASPFVSKFLKINNYFYFILIAIAFLFTLPSILNRSILQGLLKFKELIISSLFENAAKLIIGVILVFIGLGVGGALGGFTLSVIVGWVVAGTYISYGQGDGKNINVKPLFLFTIPVVVNSFTSILLYSSDLILVKHFFSEHQAGLYAALSTLARIIFFATGPVGAVMYPLISKRSASGADYKKVFILSFLLTLFFSLCILIIYYFLPDLMINLLYGELYLEVAPLLFWFGLFISIYTLSTLLINFNLSLGRTGVVVFPVIAAIMQIFVIWVYHPSLFSVILLSIVVCIILLILLILYSGFKEKVHLWR